MSQKKKKNIEGIVYSTDENFSYQYTEEHVQETLPPAQQILKVSLDSKARKGKQVTLVTGFVGTASDLETLAKQLKNFCGVGGSAKENEIILQGDWREKIILWLTKEGYKVKK